MTEGARVQLCGSFVVEVAGRDLGRELAGRQAKVVFARLVLSRPHPVQRGSLVDALWGQAPPLSAGSAMTVVLSKLRACIGPDILRGRTQLSVLLPEPAVVDVEVAQSALHTAESAVTAGEWRKAWFAALTAHFVARRPFLPEASGGWVESWRHRLGDADVRAREAYVTACLQLGGAELAGAERAARDLVAEAPLRETGHLLLMRALAARGNVAEALAAYDRLRVLLRDELGIEPGRVVQDAYLELLR